MASRLGLETTFLHSRLSHSDRIRIFHLFPGREDSIVEGSLIEADINEARLTYDAISYVWGDPTKTSTILCDGQSLSIPTTLNIVLQRLRRTAKQKTVFSLWADSICIDQDANLESLSERSYQVGKMGLIFSSAKKVYIDLGDVPSDTYQNLGELYEVMKDVSWTNDYPNMLRVKLRDTKNLPQTYHAGWQSLAKLMSSPWFTRMWVIQEFALAKDVVLLLGSDIESDAHFLELATKCGCYFLYNDELNRDLAVSQIRYTILLRYMNIALLHKQRAMIQSELGVTWQQFNSILVLRENFAATDCRDFVYALLGLAPSNSTHLLAADYDESPHELGRRLYLHFLAHGHGVYGLYQCLGTHSSSVSWSIQLEPTPRDVIFNVISDGTSETFNACGDTKSHITYHDKPPALTTRAYLPETISLIFPKPVPSRPSTSDNTLIPMIWLQELLNWLTTHNFSPLDRDAESLSRTLCRGRYQPESDSAIQSQILPLISTANLPTNQSSNIFDILKTLPSNTQVLYNRIITVLDLIQARTFAVSNAGRFCFVPEQSCTGDRVVVISGAPIPFVLRPVVTEEGNGKAEFLFRIVGACYVDGIMKGEVLDPERRLEEVDIEIR